MLAGGEPDERVKPLAQLAADLRQGTVSLPSDNPTVTKAPFAAGVPFTPLPNIAATETPALTEFTAETELQPETAVLSTPSFEQTPLSPQEFSTPTPRPTFTPTQGVNAPFILVSQDTICDPTLSPGLMQFMLLDARRKQVAGVQIIVTWDKGEDSFFTGFKPEIGDGYADFIMEANTVYSVRVVDGSSFVPNISAPNCADDNEGSYLGGLLLTFQQP
ncbi:MAG: hypothetical protein LDL51_12685, partial [Chloroflexi bacterium]|nr:hypothetical protein [Chloroflexota bacterium]